MWPNPQESADLVTFTGEILNGKLYFLCSDKVKIIPYKGKIFFTIIFTRSWPKVVVKLLRM